MFLQHTDTNRIVEPFLLIPVTAGESYEPGETLYLGTDGTATKCAGTTVPDFICQSKVESAVAGDYISATLVNAQQQLEVPLAAAGTDLKAGSKVTIGTDGLTVTATTTSGVFLITEILGTAVGDKVRGYFKR